MVTRFAVPTQSKAVPISVLERRVIGQVERRIVETPQIHYENATDQFTGLFQRGMKILDAGCGTGGLGPVLDKCGLRYCGIDFSQGLITEALERNPHLFYKVMNLRNLKFADDTFDGVNARFVFNRIRSDVIDRVLSEMRRVMTPASIGIFALPYNVRETRETDCDGTNYYILWGIDDFTLHLTKAGFKIIKFVPLPETDSMIFFTIPQR